MRRYTARTSMTTIADARRAIVNVFPAPVPVSSITVVTVMSVLLVSDGVCSVIGVVVWIGCVGDSVVSTTEEVVDAVAC